MSFENSPPDEDWALSNAYWFMVLSNGQTVYQSKHDSQEKSSWLSLKKYILDNGLRINTVVLKFRSNEIHYQIKPNVEWVYLSKAVGKEWSADSEDKFFVFGWQATPTVIERHWYKVPELTLFKEVADELVSPNLKQEFLLKMPLLDSH